MQTIQMMKKISNNSDQKVFLRDSDISTLSLLRKFKVDAQLVFLKKGHFFELISIEGIDVVLAHSFQVEQSSMIYSLLKDTNEVITQKEVLNSCKESVFFHKEGRQKFREEIDYWEKLGLENFYPVSDKVHGLIGFVVFSSGKKQITRSNLKNFKTYIEEQLKNTFEGVRDKNKDKEVFLYKGLYELQRDMLELSNENKHEKAFSYFQEILNSGASIMYVLQDKYYVPLKYKKVAFIKPLIKNDFNSYKQVALIKIDNGLFLFEELDYGEAIIMKASKKSVFVFKLESNSKDVDLNFLSTIIDILGKYLDD